jgi:hypothetical protein
MDHEVTLRKIAQRLIGIHKDQLSTAERQIINILIDCKFVKYDDHDNVIEIGPWEHIF